MLESGERRWLWASIFRDGNEEKSGDFMAMHRTVMEKENSMVSGGHAGVSLSL